MTTMTKTYKGYIIRECEYAKGEHKGRWYIQSYHHTGVSYSDDGYTAHYNSLADCREAINEQIAHNAISG